MVGDPKVEIGADGWTARFERLPRLVDDYELSAIEDEPFAQLLSENFLGWDNLSARTLQELGEYPGYSFPEAYAIMGAHQDTEVPDRPVVRLSDQALEAVSSLWELELPELLEKVGLPGDLEIPGVSEKVLSEVLLITRLVNSEKEPTNFSSDPKHSSAPEMWTSFSQRRLASMYFQSVPRSGLEALEPYLFRGFDMINLALQIQKKTNGGLTNLQKKAFESIPRVVEEMKDMSEPDISPEQRRSFVDYDVIPHFLYAQQLRQGRQRRPKEFDYDTHPLPVASTLVNIAEGKSKTQTRNIVRPIVMGVTQPPESSRMTATSYVNLKELGVTMSPQREDVSMSDVAFSFTFGYYPEFSGTEASTQPVHILEKQLLKLPPVTLRAIARLGIRLCIDRDPSYSHSI